MKSNNINDFMEIVRDRDMRVALAQRSHFYFFQIYFSSYVQYRTAPFQREIFRITEDEENKLAVIIAHRGAGKSTILTTSFPIWAILGKLKKRNVLIVCQTKLQANQHLSNIKRELEENALLESDLGPIKDESTWNMSTLVFKRTGARISAVSKEQKFRGARHKEVRPDLIIVDDLDDSSSVKTQEARDKTFNWYASEVVPLGEPKTKFVITGNMLHENSFIKRIEASIEKHKGLGTYKEYPVVDKDGKILWPGKYPTMKAVEMEKAKVGNDRIWLREYELKIIYDGEAVIKKEWIKYYDEIPPELMSQKYSCAIGVDMASVPGENNDNTAIVVSRVYNIDGKNHIYIQAHSINKQMTSDQTLDFLNELDISLGKDIKKRFYIEGGGPQTGTIDMMKKYSKLDIVEIGINGLNKKERMYLAGFPMEKGLVHFEKPGNEILANQIIYLGDDKADDLADAYSTLIRGVEANPPRPNLGRIQISVEGFYDRPGSGLPRTPRSHQDWSRFLDEEDRREYGR